jgi:hypothetical protein
MALPMKVLCVGSILTLAFLPCCCGRRDRSKATTSKQETGDVVADVNALHGDFIAALKRLHWSGPDGFEKCVLEPETTVEDDPRASWDRLRAKLPGLERGTYDSFWSENERARPVAPLDRGAMKLRVLTRAEAAELKAILHDNDRSDYWDILRNRYGTDLRIGLSAPGFSGDRKQAMIYYEAGFDWLGSWGSYCLLKREGDRWEIAGEYCCWAS